MNNKEVLFRAAAQGMNTAAMQQVAEEAIRETKSEAERAMWRKRLDAIKQGRMIKFGRGEVEDIR